MIFYRATDAEGLVHWLTVRTDAAKMDPDFTEHDIANDKGSIKDLLNDCERQLHELRQLLAAAGKAESPSAGEDGVLDSRPEPSPTPSLDTTCPACHRTHRAAEAIAQSKDIAVLTDWLFEAPPAVTINILSSVGSRLGEHIIESKGHSHEQ